MQPPQCLTIHAHTLYKSQHRQRKDSRHGERAEPNWPTFQHRRVGLQPGVSSRWRAVADRLQEVRTEESLCDDVLLGHYGHRVRTGQTMGGACSLSLARGYRRICIHQRSGILDRRILLET